MNVSKWRSSAWYPLFVACLCMLIVAASNGMANAGLTVFDEALLNEFGWSVGELKIRDSINFLGAALLAITVGHVVDRIGFKWPLLFGLAVLAFSYFIYSFIQSLLQVYALHILLAVVLASAGSTVAVIAAASSMPERRGLAVGITLAGSSVGGIIFPPMATWLNQTYGWREALRMEAIIPVLIFVLVALLLRNIINTKPEDTADVSHDGMSFKRAMGSWQFYFIAIAAAFTFYSVLALFAHLFLYMRQLEFTPQTASLAISVFSLSALVGKVLFGWLSDLGSPFALLRVNMLVMLLGLAGIFDLPAQIWLFIAITAIGWGGLHTLYNSTILALFGMRSAGKIVATFSVFQSIGAGIGAAATGMLFDYKGDYSLAFAVVLGLMLIGFLLTVILRPVNDKAFGV